MEREGEKKGKEESAPNGVERDVEELKTYRRSSCERG